MFSDPDFEDHPAFEVRQPDEQLVPFVFNSPHSGRFYPPRFLAMSRLEAQRHRFLRRLSDPAHAWHAMDTPEGEAILNGWAQPGPGGVTPVVCTP